MVASHTAQVLVASNRGPVSYSLGEDGALSAKRGGGGLVSGLSAIGPDADAVWVCSAHIAVASTACSRGEIPESSSAAATGCMPA